MESIKISQFWKIKFFSSNKKFWISNNLMIFKWRTCFSIVYIQILSFNSLHKNLFKMVFIDLNSILYKFNKLCKIFTSDVKVILKKSFVIFFTQSRNFAKCAIKTNLSSNLMNLSRVSNPKKKVSIERRLQSWNIEYDFKWNQPYLKYD